jgi:hypothetical protein
VSKSAVDSVDVAFERFADITSTAARLQVRLGKRLGARLSSRKAPSGEGAAAEEVQSFTTWVGEPAAGLV